MPGCRSEAVPRQNPLRCILGGRHAPPQKAGDTHTPSRTVRQGEVALVSDSDSRRRLRVCRVAAIPPDRSCRFINCCTSTSHPRMAGGEAHHQSLRNDAVPKGKRGLCGAEFQRFLTAVFPRFCVEGAGHVWFSLGLSWAAHARMEQRVAKSVVEGTAPMRASGRSAQPTSRRR
ncbi:hypothetical protein VUR80DRAFT_4511 [Thermomyces stellatus]